MTSWYDYMLMAAKDAGQDGDVWLRYLSKVIQADGTKLSDAEVRRLLQSPALSPFQKVTLQDALTDGTHTHDYVVRARRHTKPKDILKLFREGHYG